MTQCYFTYYLIIFVTFGTHEYEKYMSAIEIYIKKCYVRFQYNIQYLVNANNSISFINHFIINTFLQNTRRHLKLELLFVPVGNK